MDKEVFTFGNIQMHIYTYTSNCMREPLCPARQYPSTTVPLARAYLLSAARDSRKVARPLAGPLAR